MESPKYEVGDLIIKNTTTNVYCLEIESVGDVIYGIKKQEGVNHSGTMPFSVAHRWFRKLSKLEKALK